MINDRAVIIAGGSSIKGFDLELLGGQFTFGLNYVYRFMDPVSIVWVDKDFYAEERHLLEKSKAIKIARKDCVVSNDTILLQDSRKKYYGKSSLKDGIYSSYMVGLFALTMCIALEFNEIFLLGYDCRYVNNESHFHNIEHRGKYNEKAYLKSAGMFNVYKDSKSKIYNVSEVSLIDVFQKITYEDFIKKLCNYKVEKNVARQWLHDKLKVWL